MEVWTKALETNIASVFTTTMAFLELLDEGNKRRSPEKPKSQVIAIGSVAGLARGLPSFIYGASKAGVTHLMKSLGGFLVPHDIRTNVVAPGCKPLNIQRRTRCASDTDRQ
jgi:NAD(P)-dependent dehydrogenase (short-subunit alcohol dehydrogenase family)